PDVRRALNEMRNAERQRIVARMRFNGGGENWQEKEVSFHTVRCRLTMSSLRWVIGPLATIEPRSMIKKLSATARHKSRYCSTSKIEIFPSFLIATRVSPI